MKRQSTPCKLVFFLFCLIPFAACVTSEDVYVEPAMDFSSARVVAVLPFQNLSGSEGAAERVRDTFMGMLLATEALYVLPPGEVARAISRAGPFPAEGPSSEQVKRLSDILEANVVITGVLREYGVVRSGSASANVVSLSLSMIESSTGQVVWSASSTRGGISYWDRLFGGGGEPMNTVTEKVVNDLLDKLFQ